MYKARLIQVIETDLELRGKGLEGDPYRRVTQYYSPEGELLAENDPIPKGGKKYYLLKHDSGFLTISQHAYYSVIEAENGINDSYEVVGVMLGNSLDMTWFENKQFKEQS